MDLGYTRSNPVSERFKTIFQLQISFKLCNNLVLLADYNTFKSLSRIPSASSPPAYAALRPCSRLRIYSFSVWLAYVSNMSIGITPKGSLTLHPSSVLA